MPPLNAGTIKELNPSMLQELEKSESLAQAIEIAFEQQWPAVMGDLNFPEDRRQLRLLFVAVAQGIIIHLRNNPTAFAVRVELPDLDGSVSKIDTTFDSEISAS